MTAPVISEPGLVQVMHDARRVRVVLSGDIDAHLAPDLLQAHDLVQRSGLRVEVDASHVSFMDSTGVSFLASLGGHHTEPVLLLRPPAPIMFLVEMTGVDQLVTIVDDIPAMDPLPESPLPPLM